MWEEYLDKKQKVSNKVKFNLVAHKAKVIHQNASKAAQNKRAYWNMLKRLNKSGNYPIRIKDPDNPNITITYNIEIKKKMTSYWSGLGNSDKSVCSDTLSQLDQLEIEPPHPETLSSVIIDADKVKAAISRLQNGKATGIDNVPGEFIKFGGPKLQSALLDMFLLIKMTEKMLEEWYQGIVKPIHKSGSTEDLGNYRGITISTIIYKVLLSIIERQVMDYAEDRNLFGEYQGAFRKGRRCEDNIFSLKGLCALRKNKKQKKYLAFMDISKAFDTLDRNKLFLHMWSKGIQDKAWRLIKMLYKQVDNRVIFGPFECDWYQVEN